jgi:hypothetical protein
MVLQNLLQKFPSESLAPASQETKHLSRLLSEAEAKSFKVNLNTFLIMNNFQNITTGENRVIFNVCYL